jgi:hypothetical protein
MHQAYRFVTIPLRAALLLSILLPCADRVLPTAALATLPGGVHREAITERARLSSIGAQLLFLGDSTNMFPDREAGSVSARLIDTLGAGPGVDLSAMGYNHSVFSRQLEVLASTGGRPRAVVVPVNLRGFSAVFRAGRRWTGHQLVLRYGLYLTVRALEVSKLPLSGADLSLIDHPITYRGRAIGTRTGLLTPPVPLAAAGAHHLTAVEQRTRISLIDNYANPIAGSDEWSSFERSLRVAKEVHAPVFFYVTPLNFPLMRRLLSREELADVEHNLALLTQLLERDASHHLDLSHWLDTPASFCDPPDYPAEHLCPEARKQLGDRLASWLSASIPLAGARTMRLAGAQ